MTATRQPMGFDSITLRPKITVAVGTDIDAVAAMVTLAHEQCYIANTLRCDMSVVPQIEAGGS
jgi:uncharacterized OsmC-like protein